MTLKKNFALRKVADEFLLVPVGKTSKEYCGVFTLTRTAAFIFHELKNGKDKDEILNNLVEFYNVDKDIAEKDLDSFLSILKGENII